MAKQVRAGIYARVSTDDKGQDPETQLVLLRDYCTNREWQFKEYIDHSSSSDSKRLGLKQLQNDIAWRRVNTVVIYRFDRLTRSLRELLDLGDDWNRRGVDMISLSENVDTTSVQGRLVFQIMGAMAEFEKNLIGERVRTGLARAKRQGRHIGRNRLFVRIPTEVVEKLQKGEISLYEAAKRTGITRMTLSRRLKERGIVVAQKSKGNIPSNG